VVAPLKSLLHLARCQLALVDENRERLTGLFAGQS
jgi:hypothetical protein